MRLVDADALKDSMKNAVVRHICTNTLYNTIMAVIDGSPTAERWIPCSERLPKKGEVVLITNGKGNVRCGQYRSEHDVRGGTHYWWWKGKTIESVLAWMPLPKPCKGGDDECV